MGDELVAPQIALIHDLVILRLVPLADSVRDIFPVGRHGLRRLGTKLAQDGSSGNAYVSRDPEIGPMTTPRVFRGVSDDPGAHGIEVQVTHQGKEVGVFVAKDCLVPPLKEVPDLSVSAIEVPDIRCPKPQHDPRKNNIPRFQEQVDMIRHEHIGVKRKSETIAC
jgi:hypothetical protein